MILTGDQSSSHWKYQFLFSPFIQSSRKKQKQKLVILIQLGALWVYSLVRLSWVTFGTLASNLYRTKACCFSCAFACLLYSLVWWGLTLHVMFACLTLQWQESQVWMSARLQWAPRPAPGAVVQVLVEMYGRKCHLYFN